MDNYGKEVFFIIIISFYCAHAQFTLQMNIIIYNVFFCFFLNVNWTYLTLSKHTNILE